MKVEFNNIRREKIKTSRRTRQCCICNSKIEKGSQYLNTEIRYDKTIISLYQHLNCKQWKS